MVYFAAVAYPVQEEPGGQGGVHDQADVRARVAQADRHPRVVEQLLDRVHPLVQEREVEQGPAVGLEGDPDERFGDRLTVPLRVRGERRLGIGGVVDRVVG